jgi:hypothetical protein
MPVTTLTKPKVKCKFSIKMIKTPTAVIDGLLKTRNGVSFKCDRDVTLREQLYKKGTYLLPSLCLNLHDVETAKLRRWNLELVLCVMKSVFSKFPFV